MDKVRTSKFLSLVLRHQPERIGLSLDREGWVAVTDLLSAMARAGRPLTRGLLDEIVSEDRKQRYAFNDERTRIRANQGHSITVEIAYDQVPPPDELFHGTASRSVDSIMAVG